MKTERPYIRLAMILAGVHYLAVAVAFVGIIAAMTAIGTYKDGPNVVADICFFTLWLLLFPSGVILFGLGLLGFCIAPFHSLAFGFAVGGIIHTVRILKRKYKA